jgi:hypothetical protein
MKKIVLLLIISALSLFLFACAGEEEPNLIGNIEKVDKDYLILKVEENNSKIGETDRVILIGTLDFKEYEKGQKVKALIYDEGVRLSNPPQVSTKSIELIK